MRDTVSTSGVRPELLQVAELAAREKGIEREEVLEAMEMAIQKAARAKYGLELDIRVNINSKSGEITIHRYREVVDEIVDDVTQMLLKDAQICDPSLKLGDFYIELLPAIELGRVAAQSGKQIITQRIRDAERERQYEEFKNRVGDIVSGLVKRVEFGVVTIDLGGRAEAVLKREESIPREMFRPGDRIRAYVLDVKREVRGPQILLSRTHPQFMAKLFCQEVPEIYDGIIEIRAVARDPGSRAKIGVYTPDSGIDPVGSCVGVRGVRVQAVVNELQGEKVDIIPWSSDSSTFVVNALTPAEVIKVVLDEEAHAIDVVVPDDQLSIAIGRRGQNVRLASMLTGWTINITTESLESERRNEDMKVRSALFKTALDVDEVIAHLLVAEGFNSLEEVAFVPLEELVQIEGFDEVIAQELQRRAKEVLEKNEKEIAEEISHLGIAQDLNDLELAPEILVALARKGIKTRDELADLSTDELLEIFSGTSLLSETDAQKLILNARAHWFEKETLTGSSES